MYKVDDIVLYGADGIFQVAEITTRRVGDARIEYYVLKSCGPQKSTVYVPTGNEALVSKISKMLSKDEILELIHAMPGENTIWIENDNARMAKYNEILSSDDRRAIFQLVKTLAVRQQELKEQKRKLRASDEQFLREAERRLHEEFAHVLNIDQEEVLPFIFSQIQGWQGDAAAAKPAAL